MAGKKGKYAKPKLKTGKLKEVSDFRHYGVATLKATPAFSKSGKPVYVRKYSTLKVRNIMAKLKATGLNVEGPGNVSDKRITASESVGPALDSAMVNDEIKNLRKTVLDAFRPLGKVHAEEVAHNHPHIRNFHINNNEVYLTDFRLAENVRPQWKKPQ